MCGQGVVVELSLGSSEAADDWRANNEEIDDGAAIVHDASCTSWCKEAQVAFVQAVGGFDGARLVSQSHPAIMYMLLASWSAATDPTISKLHWRKPLPE